VQVKRLGGGFGSKISRASQVAAACAVAANALKRPVRMVLDLRENMRIVGGRASLKTKYEVFLVNSFFFYFYTFFNAKGCRGQKWKNN